MTIFAWNFEGENPVQFVAIAETVEAARAAIAARHMDLMPAYGGVVSGEPSEAVPVEEGWSWCFKMTGAPEAA
jgi:hypothetical protein